MTIFDPEHKLFVSEKPLPTRRIRAGVRLYPAAVTEVKDLCGIVLAVGDSVAFSITRPDKKTTLRIGKVKNISRLGVVSVSYVVPDGTRPNHTATRKGHEVVRTFGS